MFAAAIAVTTVAVTTKALRRPAFSFVTENRMGPFGNTCYVTSSVTSAPYKGNPCC